MKLWRKVLKPVLLSCGIVGLFAAAMFGTYLAVGMLPPHLGAALLSLMGLAVFALVAHRGFDHFWLQEEQEEIYVVEEVSGDDTWVIGAFLSKTKAHIRIQQRLKDVYGCHSCILATFDAKYGEQLDRKEHKRATDIGAECNRDY